MMNQLAFFCSSNKSTHVLPHIDNQMIDVYTTRTINVLGMSTKHTGWNKVHTIHFHLRTAAAAAAAVAAYAFMWLVTIIFDQFAAHFLLLWLHSVLYILHMCDFPVEREFLTPINATYECAHVVVLLLFQFYCFGFTCCLGTMPK